MKKQIKPKVDSLLRVPKTNKLGLKIKPIAMPHDDLIKAEKPPVELAKVPEPIQPNLSNDSLTNPILVEKIKNPTAPIKDFQRVPNSITRDAVPSGLFKGTSKSTYDTLYLKTRGAVNPVRAITATKRELMKWIGISHVTIYKHLKHLELIGLIRIEQNKGSHEGSVYEILIPEEVEPNLSNAIPSYPILPNLSHPILSNDNQTDAILSNNVVSLPYNNLVSDSMGNLIENKTTYETRNTSFKYNKNIDDEPFGEMVEILTNGSQKVSGKHAQKTDKAKWGELAELLVMELEIAAARTGSISNVPAFLTEHLRRRLSRPVIKEVKSSSNAMKISSTADCSTTTDQEVTVEEYIAEMLSEEGRETVLKTFREYVDKGQREFVMGFEKTYAPEDWAYLIEKLGE